MYEWNQEPLCDFEQRNDGKPYTFEKKEIKKLT